MGGVVVVPRELSLVGLVGNSSRHLLMFVVGNECRCGVCDMCVVCARFYFS